MSLSPPGPLVGVDLVGALGGEDGAVQLRDGLTDFATRLSQRRRSDWIPFRVRPSDVEWLGTELDWTPDEVDSVTVEVRIRSWIPVPLRADSVRLWRLASYLTVACECDRDHGNHDVDGREFEGSSPAGLGRAFDMTLAQVDDWMSRGIVADAWREWAGLPMRVPPA
jgi:hypothetical protein